MNEHCPVCKSTDATDVPKQEIVTHVQSGTRFPVKNLVYKKCQECYTRYQVNIPMDILKQLYKADYKKKYSLKKKILLKVPYSTHYNQKILFTRYLQPGKMIDVGCSEGKFMYLMQRRGWKVEGIEPSRCAKFAVDFYKFQVYNCTLEDFPEKKKYDLVSCLATLEHVFNPCEFVRHLKGLMAKDGRLFIAVPTKSYCVEHLTFFSVYGITRMLHDLGLEVEKLESKNNKILVVVR